MVSFADFNARGMHNWILQDLRAARGPVNILQRGGRRPLLVSNVTPSGQFIGDADDTLRRITGNLRESSRLFRQGNSLVFLRGSSRPGGGCAPTPIAVDGVVTDVASAIVRNVVMCREVKANSTGKGAKVDQPGEYEIQFAVPKAVLQQAVVLDGFADEIPEVRYIVNHPVFDEDFNWLDVGYHASARVLVCGESFDPVDLGEPPRWSGPPASVDEVFTQLPVLTRQWVEGFHWKTPIDLINYLGAAMMIPLMPMLVEDGHPGVMFWGNQPSIGKSVAAQCLSVLKDGEQASPTAVDGGAREVENQIASELNDGRTVLFIDNQKGALNIPILEANMTAAELAIRGFHVQRKVRRANDILWLITTNDAAPSDDLLSRCVHIRLHYEGEPETHRFSLSESELITHLRTHRSAILSELAGLVTRWLDAGRPSAPSMLRFRKCASIIGSVLAHSGLPGFLSNTREEVKEHSSKHQQLIALVERLVDSRDKAYVWEVDFDIDSADAEFKRRSPPAKPMEQKDWIACLMTAGVIPTTCDTPQKKKVAATQYLNGVLKVPVDVEVGDRMARAMIVSRPLRSNRVAYTLAVQGLSSQSAVAGDSEGAPLLCEGAGEPVGGATELRAPAPEAPDDGRKAGGLWR